MPHPLKRVLPAFLGVALLLPVAACDDAGEVGDAETEGDAVIVTPAPEAGTATDD